jgi:cation diffusion facilitator family transporter
MSGGTEVVSRSDERAKQLVALSSVGAAVLLTTLKVVVGIATGSLGILSEAAHSGLDLLAAIVTLFAVRVAGRPADRLHPYGYGKAENLGALAETVILLVTCVWIVYEAIRRLTGAVVEVDANVFAFGVMLTSIAVDFGRSRALMRAAKRYDSQALQADALHFSTDILSSCVVVAGLTLVRLAGVFDVPALERADAIAALGVAGIVVLVSLRLARAASSALLDVAPEGLADKIRETAARVEGVREVRQARVRKSGAASFVDLTIAVSRRAHFERAHAIAENVVNAVRSAVPRSDVVVHVDPLTDLDETLGDTVEGAAGIPRHPPPPHAHGLRLHNVGGVVSLELHVEVPARLSLGEAHQLVTDFESSVKAEIPWLSDVNSHIEPIEEARATTSEAKDVETIRQKVRAVALSRKIDVHKIEVFLADDEWHVSLHFLVPPETSVVAAHRESERLEKALREAIPDLGRIVLHAEPPGDRVPDL